MAQEITYLLFALLGLLVGILGTLMGAGGGFILVPVLLFLWPGVNPGIITSVSLAVVFLNALSGSFAYIRLKWVDFRSATMFAIATLPGSLIGAMLVHYVPKNIFDIIFGILLVIISIYLIFKPLKMQSRTSILNKGYYRKLTDAKGDVYEYSYNLPMAIILSVFVGFISSMAGIGGGIIHVPALVNLFNFPVHIATATSHFTLVFTALAATIEHVVDGSLHKYYPVVLSTGLGVVIGAQLGARLAKRLKAKLIIRGLAIALGSVGVRIFLSGIMN